MQESQGCHRIRQLSDMQGIQRQCKGSDWHARESGFIQRIRQLTDMQGSRGWFTEKGNWQTYKKKVFSTVSGSWLTYKRASVQCGVRQLTDIQESQCSVRCQAADWHTREPVFSTVSGADWHARGPVFNTVSGSWLACERASVRYGVRQLTDIQKSQCSVRCQTADRHIREPVFNTISDSWLTYKRASVQYDIRQLTDIQESQCSIRCQAADCHAREPFFITASGSWLACKKVRVHSQGKATDMYESQDSVQGQAHRSPECGTSIVLGSVFRSQPKDRLCWFGIFCDCFQSHQTCNNRTSNWAVASSFPVRCSWLIILFLDAVGFEQWTAPAKKPENK